MKVDHTFLLSVSLALLGAPLPALAQNNGGGGNNGGGRGATTGGGNNSQPPPTQAPASSGDSGNTDSGDNNTSKGGDNKSTPTGKGGSKTTDDSGPTGTPTITGGEAADTNAPPGLSTSVSSVGKPTTTFGGDVTGALDGPTLPSIVGVIPDYVAQVPVTAKNPFMQKSNLPEGTVFIAVGSALGLIGLICVAWRAIVAWSLRRSLRRSAIENHYSDSKTMLGPSGGNSTGHTGGAARKKSRNSGLYTSQFGSSLSLDHLANGPGGANRGNSTPNSSLFFSPTAGSGALTPGHRGSGYLPAGYYSAAGGNSSQTNLPRRPNTAGTMTGHSPPSSPLPKPPSRGRLPTPHDSPRLGTSHSAHSSIAGLAAPQGQQRTPSTYLEDLFEQHPPPSSHGNRDSYGPNGSGRSRHSQYGRNY